jgi:site-specific DNA-methyltransferase (adenine-specific)
MTCQRFEFAGYLGERLSLYQGDGLAVLAELPSASVDGLITDPPYSSGGMTRGDRAGMNPNVKYVNTATARTLQTFAGDNRDQRGYAYWTTLWLTEALRVVRPGGICALFTDWRQLPTTTDALQAGGWIWRGVVPWAKPNCRPHPGRFAAECEYVAWGSAGAMPVDYAEECLPGFFHAMAPKEREHITQKPVEVLRELVRIVPPDGVVLDPFMGAGTTGVAAMIEGRRFVGVEITSHFARLAHDRILAAAGCAIPRGSQLSMDLEAS